MIAGEPMRLIRICIVQVKIILVPIPINRKYLYILSFQLVAKHVDVDMFLARMDCGNCPTQLGKYLNY